MIFVSSEFFPQGSSVTEFSDTLKFGGACYIIVYNP